MSRAPEDIVLSLLASKETILSLPAPPAITFSPEDEPAKEVGTSGAMLGVSGTALISLRL